MIPSKNDRIATFQKIARVKSWAIEMEEKLERGNLGMAQAPGQFLF